MANICKALKADMDELGKPIYMTPSVTWGRRPSITYSEWNEAWVRCSGLKTKKPPTLVVPSLWWECAGMYTVYVLCCVLTYLQFGI